MKKIVSLFLVLIMVLSVSVVSFAEETITDYNWDQVSSLVQEFFGGTINLALIDEVEATFWIPGTFYIAELSEEDISNNCIGYLLTEDGSAFILIYYMDMPVASLDALLSYNRGQGLNSRMINVNGIPAVRLEDPANDSLSVSFQTQENKLFQMYFYPATNDYYSAVFDMVIASIFPDEVNIPGQEASEPEPPAPVNPVSSLISK